MPTILVKCDCFKFYSNLSQIIQVFAESFTCVLFKTASRVQPRYKTFVRNVALVTGKGPHDASQLHECMGDGGRVRDIDDRGPGDADRIGGERSATLHHRRRTD